MSIDNQKRQKRTEAQLIAAGVRNLQEFGYPECNKQNILTDQIYRRFFISMLNENKGKSDEVDAAIDSLLTKTQLSG